ncbi:MAG: glycosyltransferase family A protein [archaeon]
MKFIDLTQYVYNPPNIDELCGKILDKRDGRKKDLAVIVVASGSQETLHEFLNFVSKQSYKKFDVIIIYNTSDPFYKKFDNKLSILHIIRKRNLGFGGAVYLGQKIAVKEKYKYITFFDVDRFVANQDAFKLMITELEKNPNISVVMGLCEYSNKKDYRLVAPSIIGGIFKREFLEKHGYYYLPFYFGMEDNDFAGRVYYSKEYKILNEVLLTHPYHAFFNTLLFLWKNSTKNIFPTQTKILYTLPEVAGVAKYISSKEVYGMDPHSWRKLRFPRLRYAKYIWLLLFRFNIISRLFLSGLEKTLSGVLHGRFKYPTAIKIGKDVKLKIKLEEIKDPPVFDQFFYSDSKEVRKIIDELNIKYKEKISIPVARGTLSNIKPTITLLTFPYKGKVAFYYSTIGLFWRYSFLRYIPLALRLKEFYVIYPDGKVYKVYPFRQGIISSILWSFLKSTWQTFQVIYAFRHMPSTYKYGLKTTKQKD